MAGGIIHPTSIATLPIGGPAGRGAYGLARLVAAEAGIGMATEATMVSSRQRMAAELDLPAPDPITDIAMAGIAAVGLAGAAGLAFEGVRRWSSYGVERNLAAAQGRPVDASPGQHQANVAQAERALNEGQSLPDLAPDAPPGWAGIRGGIFRGESGGDFNALFGFSNREGGPWSHIKLTDMTVDETIEFSRPDGDYARWVRARVGRTATPMGAYQIVGSTLRAVKKGLGLRGDELMTADLQERLGQWIYRQQGVGAWEGYRGPDPDFIPGDGGGFQGGSFTPTRRGYTSDGQIAAGDMRIDVGYEVVDASLLRRATGRFQPRDRSRANSEEWIATTAARLDPAQLMPSPNAANGTPSSAPTI